MTKWILASDWAKMQRSRRYIKGFFRWIITLFAFTCVPAAIELIYNDKRCGRKL